MLGVFGVKFLELKDLDDATFVLVDFLEDYGEALALSLVDLLVDKVSLNDGD